MLTPVSLPNLNHILEPTLILIPVNLELKSLILQSHIPLMENECEPQLFDLDPTLEPNLTPEPLLYFSNISESVLVPVPFTFERKSTISLNHIPLLHQDVG